MSFHSSPTMSQNKPSTVSDRQDEVMRVVANAVAMSADNARFLLKLKEKTAHLPAFAFVLDQSLGDEASKLQRLHQMSPQQSAAHRYFRFLMDGYSYDRKRNELTQQYQDHTQQQRQQIQAQYYAQQQAQHLQAQQQAQQQQQFYQYYYQQQQQQQQQHLQQQVQQQQQQQPPPVSSGDGGLLPQPPQPATAPAAPSTAPAPEHLSVAVHDAPPQTGVLGSAATAATGFRMLGGASRAKRSRTPEGSDDE